MFPYRGRTVISTFLPTFPERYSPSGRYRSIWRKMFCSGISPIRIGGCGGGGGGAGFSVRQPARASRHNSSAVRRPVILCENTTSGSARPSRPPRGLPARRDHPDPPGVLRTGGDLPETRLPHHPGDLARRVGPPPPGHGHHVDREEGRAGRGGFPVVEEELLHRRASPGRQGCAGPPQEAKAVGRCEGVQDLRYPDEVVRPAEGILEEVPPDE